MAGKQPVNLENQIKDIRKQLSEQLGCLDFRMESKMSLLSEFQEFFKRRGEVEYEYARQLERLCEKFEKNTKQRNIRTEVRSTFNLWSTLLAETRKTSRERANYAEVMASEMMARLEIMAKDVTVLSKKCKEMCADIQDGFTKELRNLSEQTKVYQHSCHNTTEAYSKLTKSKEKSDATRGTARKKKALEKELERQQQYKVQEHLLMKNRNELLLGISRCNSLAMQYFNMDIMDMIEYMDFDYHNSFRRLALAYQETEREACDAALQSASVIVEQGKGLNFENDLHYFLSEFAQPFTPPTPFHFTPFDSDNVTVFKVTTEDVFKRARKTVAEIHEEIKTLEIQREEDVKTIQHMEHVNLKKYQITTVDDALAVLEDNGDATPLEASRSERGTASLERGLSLTTRGGQAIHLSQKGKKDTVFFTLGVLQRRIQRADRLTLINTQLDILEKSLDEQKVPPVPVGVDSRGQVVPGQVPRLFGGDIVEYIMATGCGIPLIVESCIRAIESEGIEMEGLFRVPGPAAYTEELRAGFEEGRDPLVYTQNKVDIAAVASTLKAYFRELSDPLFPIKLYGEFIKCTRHETANDKMEAIRSTVNKLHPVVVNVMRFLFSFLRRVSRFSQANKMGSANLALVFGPTLTRAPSNVDARQLHNDVPSINVLIQLCIERHEAIFGEEIAEQGGPCEGGGAGGGGGGGEGAAVMAAGGGPAASDSTVLTLKEVLQYQPTEDGDVVLLSTSPPSDPPSAPPSTTPEAGAPQPSTVTSDDEQLVSAEADPAATSAAGATLPPPIPPRAASEEPPQQQQQQQQLQEPAPPPSARAEEEEEAVERAAEPSASTLTEEFSNLDETMKEIAASIQDISGEGEEPVTTATATARTERLQSEELSDEDTDSDDDGTGRIDARALYDYTARSDKELSFKRGDTLQVVEKTPDHNWWDGFLNGKRGFMPVSYIEVMELHSTPPSSLSSSFSGGGGLAAPPQVPMRKDSIPILDEEQSNRPTVVVPPATILEENEPQEGGAMVGDRQLQSTPEVTIEEPPPEPAAAELDATPSPSSTSSIPAEQRPSPREKDDSKPSPSEEEKLPTPESGKVARGRGSVRSLTAQFQEPPTAPTTAAATAAVSQGGGRVLVEPVPTHRRQFSDSRKAATPDPDDVIPPRSQSGGSKVGMLSSAFEKPAQPPPPPVKPKKPPLPHPAHHPPPHSPSHAPAPHPPSSSLQQQQQQQQEHALSQSGGFQIQPHSIQPQTGVSPLQRASLAGHLSTSTTVSPKRPAPPPSNAKTKGSLKVKRDKSFKKDKEEREKPSKPPPPAKPAGFIAPGVPAGRGHPMGAQQMAQLQAALKERKTAEK